MKGQKKTKRRAKDFVRNVDKSSGLSIEPHERFLTSNEVSFGKSDAPRIQTRRVTPEGQRTFPILPGYMSQRNADLADSHQREVRIISKSNQMREWWNWDKVDVAEVVPGRNGGGGGGGGLVQLQRSPGQALPLPQPKAPRTPEPPAASTGPQPRARQPGNPRGRAPVGALRFQAGDAVHVQFTANGGCYPGTVVRANDEEDGSVTYAVRYDDGEFEARVKERHVAFPPRPVPRAPAPPLAAGVRVLGEELGSDGGGGRGGGGGGGSGSGGGGSGSGGGGGRERREGVRFSGKEAGKEGRGDDRRQSRSSRLAQAYDSGGGGGAAPSDPAPPALFRKGQSVEAQEDVAWAPARVVGFEGPMVVVEFPRARDGDPAAPRNIVILPPARVRPDAVVRRRAARAENEELVQLKAVQGRIEELTRFEQQQGTNGGGGGGGGYGGDGDGDRDEDYNGRSYERMVRERQERRGPSVSPVKRSQQPKPGGIGGIDGDGAAAAARRDARKEVARRGGNGYRSRSRSGGGGGGGGGCGGSGGYGGEKALRVRLVEYDKAQLSADPSGAAAVEHRSVEDAVRDRDRRQLQLRIMQNRF